MVEHQYLLKLVTGLKAILNSRHIDPVVVSRCQTSFFYTESDNALRLKKRSGNARLDPVEDECNRRL